MNGQRESTQAIQSVNGQPIARWPLIAAGAVAILIFLFLGLADLSNAEVVLLGVVQTIFSLLAGWIITHAYAQRSQREAVKNVEELHQRNLRTYALKAAEKVENLSRELNRMVLYLNQELEETDYGSPEEELSAKEERIQSAIHILNTLKSVNDTSLSDWRGVIGDEIEEIRQRAEQREETLEKLVDRIQRLESQGSVHAISRDGADPLLREIDKLRRDLKFVAGDVMGNLWTARKPASGARQSFQVQCPACGTQFAVRQKAKDGSQKGVQCQACGTRLVSEMDSNGQAHLRLRLTVKESVICVACNSTSDISLDELIGTSTTFVCSRCHTENRATRTKTGVVVVQTLKKVPITEEVIEKVRIALPAQPWQKGIHEQVAEQLGLTAQAVQKAIAQLILRGIFMDQFQGVLCTTEEKIALMRSFGREMDQIQPPTNPDN